MHKIIAFVALFTSATLVYLLFIQQTDSIIGKNKKQPNDNVKENLLPAANKPLRETQIEKSPTHRITPPAAPIHKRIAKEKPPLNRVDQDTTYAYPIEDAEFYFIPPEQRYPGNIGGPPPIDLPDSPSTP